MIIPIDLQPMSPSALTLAWWFVLGMIAGAVVTLMLASLLMAAANDAPAPPDPARRPPFPLKPPRVLS